MEPHSPEHKILFSIGILLVIIFSLLGNLFVCLAVCHCRNLQRDVNYLIVSLAVADILTALLSMPIWMHFEITAFAHMGANEVKILANAWMFIDILTGVASIANLTSIAYERMWSVYSPLKHRRYFTKFTVSFIISGTWIYAVVVAACSFKLQHVTNGAIYINTFGYFIPLVLIIFALTRIYVIVKRSPRSMISPKENSQITRSICIVVGVFIVCWAPHTVASILSHTCCYEYMLNHLWMRSLFKFMHYANSCINPVIYGIANVQYKDAFRQVVRKLCSKFRFTRTEGVPQGSVCKFPKLNNYFNEKDENILEGSLNSEFARKGLHVNEMKEHYAGTSTTKNREADENMSVSTESTSISSPHSPTNTSVTENTFACKENISTEGIATAPVAVQEEDTLPQTDSIVRPRPLSKLKSSTSLVNMLTGHSLMDDSIALQEALLNPEHLKRTSCL